MPIWTVCPPSGIRLLDLCRPPYACPLSIIRLSFLRRRFVLLPAVCPHSRQWFTLRTGGSHLWFTFMVHIWSSWFTFETLVFSLQTRMTNSYGRAIFASFSLYLQWNLQIISQKYWFSIVKHSKNAYFFEIICRFHCKYNETAAKMALPYEFVNLQTRMVEPFLLHFHCIYNEICK